VVFCEFDGLWVCGELWFWRILVLVILVFPGFGVWFDVIYFG